MKLYFLLVRVVEEATRTYFLIYTFCAIYWEPKAQAKAEKSVI